MRLWQLYAVTIFGIVLLLIGARLLSPVNHKAQTICAANPADEIIQSACANLR